MVKEVTPSEYQKIANQPKSGRTVTLNASSLKPVAIVLAIVVVCGISFAAGAHHQKHQLGTAGVGQNGFAGGTAGQRGFRSGRRPAIGQVTAVSADSLTIKNARTGASQTFKLNSSTVVDNNGSTGAVSDIKTGDDVFVQISSSDTSTATRIILNPNLPSQPSNTTDQNSSTDNGATST